MHQRNLHNIPLSLEMLKIVSTAMSNLVTGGFSKLVSQKDQCGLPCISLQQIQRFRPDQCIPVQGLKEYPRKDAQPVLLVANLPKGKNTCYRSALSKSTCCDVRTIFSETPDKLSQ